MFGSRIEMPILVAPTGGHQQAHPDGELATMRGACAVKTIMVVSTAGPDLDTTRERVERALTEGAKVICLTVDGKYVSHRERLLRDRQSSLGPPGQPPPMARRRTAQAPAYPYRVEPQFTAQLTWRFVDE